MKHRLKSIIEELDPKSLGVNKISISSFVKLGIGEGNLNYFFSVGDKEFVCRVNIDKHSPSRSRNEFNLLKNVESLRVAPKAYHHFRKSREFPWNFNIIEFIKGKPGTLSKLAETFSSPEDQEKVLEAIGGFKQGVQLEIIKQSGGNMGKILGLREEALEGAFDTVICHGIDDCNFIPENLREPIKDVIKTSKKADKELSFKELVKSLK